MHHFTSPFPPFPFFTSSHRAPTSDTSSPPSSRATSPPTSPTSANRQLATPQHFNAVTSHGSPAPETKFSDAADSSTDPGHSHAAPAPPCGVSILPCAVLRGRSSGMVLRRRPSAVDMALHEERSRCDGNAIERQGLDLMEPRPVDMNMTVHRTWNVQPAAPSTGSRGSLRTENSGVVVQQPRFVMGGIFEVMEGRG